jgi:tetratricopeptide (TPR) repeat protein
MRLEAAMLKSQKNISSWFLLGGILAAIHTAIWILVTVAVVLSGDPEAGMAYYLFYALDYPIWRLYRLPAYGTAGTMLIFGGMQWFSCGFVIQSLFAIRRISGLLRLMTGVGLVCFVCMLPEFSLKSMSSWKEHWHRGTEATNAKDYEKAVWHLSEAVRLAPKEEHSLPEMWDYLGRVYMDLKQFDRAEEAFKNSLAVTSNDPNPPSHTHWIYFNLASLYEKTGDRQRQKECLLKQAESSRILYDGDSPQEAGCWHSLAEISRAEGKSAESRNLLERAIEIESKALPGDSFSLGYYRKQLEEWQAADNTSQK